MGYLNSQWETMQEKKKIRYIIYLKRTKIWFFLEENDEAGDCQDAYINQWYKEKNKVSRLIRFGIASSNKARKLFFSKRWENLLEGHENEISRAFSLK